MEKDDCKDDNCKVILDSGNKVYLLALGHEQIKMVTHSGSSRKRFFKALDKYNCKLKIIEK